jgi:hypothetical protein
MARQGVSDRLGDENLARRPSGGAYTAIGESVNLAARLTDFAVARPTSTTSLKLRSRFRRSSGVFRFTIPNRSPWKISTGSFDS